MLRPNIILIFVDDLGYGDLACYGNDKIKTPNLDRMFEKGQRWASFYASGSTCVPSRTGLMSGRHPAMLGRDKLRNDPSALMPAMLKRQGLRSQRSTRPIRFHSVTRMLPRLSKATP
ncbi:MAG: hypothetical protein CMO47_11355 [Verrucomicrobiales bacterium]|nr:hypothetical protein [Verrucomicrobiales bacterium]